MTMFMVRFIVDVALMPHLLLDQGPEPPDPVVEGVHVRAAPERRELLGPQQRQPRHGQDDELRLGVEDAVGELPRREGRLEAVGVDVHADAEGGGDAFLFGNGNHGVLIV